MGFAHRNSLYTLHSARVPDAILLDRDGTINVERVDYVKTIDELVLLAGALDALATLSAFGVPIVLVTNQSAIGRGIISHEQVDEIHVHLCSLVRTAGGRIDAVYLCPHRPDEGCACRKPKPGLLQTAAAEMGFDLQRSIFVGDSITDYQAARAAGCMPVLVRTGWQAPKLAQFVATEPGVVLLDDLPAVEEWMNRRLAAGQTIFETTSPVYPADWRTQRE
jgi:D-glycero-D-manno-heptose 1,7-bisphosphate phosphatase